MRPRHVVLLALAVIVLLGARLALRGDEARIRRRLDTLVGLASKEGPEEPLVAAHRARRIAEAFTDDCIARDVREERVVSGREGVARAVAWAREASDRAEVACEDLDVALDGDVARVVATLRISDPGGAASELDGTVLRLDFVREGGWRIAAASAERP